jgi:hypothetical protein
MTPEFEKILLEKLDLMYETRNRAIERATGSRGSTNNPTCNFYLGAGSVIDAIYKDIKEGKTTNMDRWIKGS